MSGPPRAPTGAYFRGKPVIRLAELSVISNGGGERANASWDSIPCTLAVKYPSGDKLSTTIITLNCSVEDTAFARWLLWDMVNTPCSASGQHVTRDRCFVSSLLETALRGTDGNCTEDYSIHHVRRDVHRRLHKYYKRRKPWNFRSIRSLNERSSEREPICSFPQGRGESNIALGEMLTYKEPVEGELESLDRVDFQANS